jgi:hypothetical protein
VDEYYHIFFPKLFDAGLDSGIDIKAEMNARLEELYPRLPQGYDHVAKLLGGHHYRNILLNPHIILPDFGPVDSVNNEMDDPLIAYAHTKDDYPIDCINCEESELDRGPPGDYVPVVAMVDLPLASLLTLTVSDRPIRIYNCLARVTEDPSYICEVCPPTSTYGGIDQDEGTGLGEVEIEIEVGTNDYKFDIDYCLDVKDAHDLDDENEDGIDGEFGNYAILSSVTGSTYFALYPEVGGKVRKVDHPIEDRQYYSETPKAKYGDVLALCTPRNDFTSYEWKKGSSRFGLGVGGLYKISRPGTPQQPLYFAFPYSQGLWYLGSPDMRIYYGTNIQTPDCANGHQNIIEDYKTKTCFFCSNGVESLGGILGIDENNVTNYIASTDFEFLREYWLDNAIILGFSETSGSFSSVVPPFQANLNNEVCTPDQSWEHVVSAILDYIELTGYSWYEFRKQFPPGESFINGQTLYVHIGAKFTNGETINTCDEIVLSNPNDSGYTYNYLNVEIRGNIKDYQEGQVNY